jgi:hypothetical protein
VPAAVREKRTVLAFELLQFTFRAWPATIGTG